MIRAASQFALIFSLHPMSALQAWLEQARQRKAFTALAALDETGLSDSHMNTAPAQQEAKQVLWDAPDHWTK